jgi:hypothetical protein
MAVAVAVAAILFAGFQTWYKRRQDARESGEDIEEKLHTNLQVQYIHVCARCNLASDLPICTLSTQSDAQAQERVLKRLEQASCLHSPPPSPPLHTLPVGTNMTKHIYAHTLSLASSQLSTDLNSR